MSDKHDISAVAPTSLAHLIGQRCVIEQATVALDAAQQDGLPFPGSLLVGPPGVGKSQVANVIAREMAATFHEVLGQSIARPADFNALLLGAEDKDVILIDEAHELGREYQTALFLALDQHRVFLPTGKSGRTPQSLPLNRFTLLLATTDEFRLLQPLRDRMKLVLRFDFYSPDELVELLQQRCRGLAWAVEDRVFQPIARRSRGTPRLALRLLQACHRVCRAEGQEGITLGHLERACQLEQIDGLGLGPTEQTYLRILTEGASRLNVIATRLGLPARSVADVTEPFLIRAGLVSKDEQGRRQLTAAGWDHLSQDRPIDV
jgi:Holliday junction DNA helicase RuvB